jgi:hypothetical protein
LRISRGLYVLGQFIWNFNPILVLIPFVLALPRDPRVRLLLWVFAAQLAYSVYVGGDAWEFWGGSNRYISIAMPGFFVLLSLALFRLSRLIIGFSMPVLGIARALGGARSRYVLFACFVAFSVISVNCIRGPSAWAEVALLVPPLHSGPGGENQSDVQEALRLQDVTTPAATIEVTRAGTIPYFLDRPGIDLLGKSDRRVAHEPMKRSSTGLASYVEFRPGHMKYDYDYSVEQLKPDVITSLWKHQEEIMLYLDKYYRAVELAGRCLYFRDDSPDVSWEKLPPEHCK